jgi:signal transduction histidine kinase
MQPMFKNSSLDLSIGQRLATGFGLFVLVVAVMLAVFFSWHAASAREQQAYSERIAPLRDRIVALERSVLRAGIAVRSVLIEPTPERVRAFEESVSTMRERLSGLGQSTMESDGRGLYVQIEPLAREYLSQARDLVERRADGPVGSEREAAIAAVRERLFDLTGAFNELQTRKATEALDQIARLRDRTSRGLITMAITAAIMLTVLAVLTTRAVSTPARALVAAADALKNGHWAATLTLARGDRASIAQSPRDEMRRLSDAIGSAAFALERREQRLRADSLLASAVASTLQREELAQRSLQAISTYLGAIVGIVYWASDSRTLIPVAQFATSAAGPLSIGDGIPGQAAYERRPLFMEQVPARDEFQVKLGYDAAPPSAIGALPLATRDALHGVLLIGSLREFTDDARAFLEASATQLSIGFANVSSFEAVQKLLVEVRESNEKIQAQNEELQAQNEQIQAQSEEIQAQHEEMHSQNEELMQQSEELRRHADELADADERKNRFLGVLAHELRNPMAPITNSLMILKQSTPGSATAQRAQAIIERQTSHLVRLIDDLLDITRISEGKIHIQRERLDLNELVRTCAEDLGAAFEQRSIALELDLPNTTVTIAGDRTRLCQVIGNLLNNTLKFCEKSGRVKLSVRVDHAHAAAVIKVADDGIGMDPELLGRLFQPFSQGVSGLARTNGGLGLGLALVRALVSLHEGTVEAHSDGSGRGAQFTIRLPLDLADSTLHDANLVAPAGALPDRKVETYRILIIEDNVDAASTLAEVLRFEGHDVAVAHAGSEGITLAKLFQPDVVLCDVGLPDVDGYTVARALRKEPTTRGALLVAVTGYASTSDKELAHSAGFDVHLAKPLEAGRLHEVFAARHQPS